MSAADSSSGAVPTGIKHDSAGIPTKKGPSPGSFAAYIKERNIPAAAPTRTPSAALQFSSGIPVIGGFAVSELQTYTTPMATVLVDSNNQPTGFRRRSSPVSWFTITVSETDPFQPLPDPQLDGVAGPGRLASGLLAGDNENIIKRLVFAFKNVWSRYQLVPGAGTNRLRTLHLYDEWAVQYFSAVLISWLHIAPTCVNKKFIPVFS